MYNRKGNRKRSRKQQAYVFRAGVTLKRRRSSGGPPHKNDWSGLATTRRSSRRSLTQPLSFFLFLFLSLFLYPSLSHIPQTNILNNTIKH